MNYKVEITEKLFTMVSDNGDLNYEKTEKKEVLKCNYEKGTEEYEDILYLCRKIKDLFVEIDKLNEV
jgi:hypothetical protein